MLYVYLEAFWHRVHFYIFFKKKNTHYNYIYINAC